MRNTSVSLGEHFSQFIELQVAQGHYSSTSEVMRAGLRLLEERNAKLAWLRHELAKGEASGAPKAFDPEALKTKLRAMAPQ